MIGAMCGDIVGSIYEFNNYRHKDFPLFGKGCFATDDSLMTIAVASALLTSDEKDLSETATKEMQRIGRPYPDCGFGGRFFDWIYTNHPEPYMSFGNGAAMRVSPCGFFGNSIEEVKRLSAAVTRVSHDHPEGMKGAECAAVCVFLARTGKTKDEIRDIVTRDYYDLDFTIDEIRPTYRFNETCMDTVPQAIEAFLESESFEDAIRTAISVGGDSDTLAAITGGIAEAFYGVPENIKCKVMTYIPHDLRWIVTEFYNRTRRE